MSVSTKDQNDRAEEPSRIINLYYRCCRMLSNNRFTQISSRLCHAHFILWFENQARTYHACKQYFSLFFIPSSKNHQKASTYSTKRNLNSLGGTFIAKPEEKNLLFMFSILNHIVWNFFVFSSITMLWTNSAVYGIWNWSLVECRNRDGGIQVVTLFGLITIM